MDGRPVSRRQVERLMRTDGLAGARRGRAFKTTRADAAAVRPPDLVQRDFTAPAPNRLWLVEFTYVPTWSGMAFTASRRPTAPAERSRPTAVPSGRASAPAASVMTHSPSLVRWWKGNSG